MPSKSVRDLYRRLPGSSRRYALKSNPRKTISERAYRQRLDFESTGQRRTKEQSTALRKAGTLAYRTEQAREAAVFNRRARPIRSRIPQITHNDLRLTIKAAAQGYNALDESEKAQFHQLFKRYPADDVREALYTMIDTSYARAMKKAA